MIIDLVREFKLYVNMIWEFFNVLVFLGLVECEKFLVVGWGCLYWGYMSWILFGLNLLVDLLWYLSWLIIWWICDISDDFVVVVRSLGEYLGDDVLVMVNVLDYMEYFFSDKFSLVDYMMKICVFFMVFGFFVEFYLMNLIVLIF